MAASSVQDFSEMFIWLNKQGVQSDRGYIFQRTGRFTAEYREDDRVVTLDVEGGLSGGLPCVILDPKAFARWNNGVAIALDRQAQLFQNVKDAMEF